MQMFALTMFNSFGSAVLYHTAIFPGFLDSLIDHRQPHSRSTLSHCPLPHSVYTAKAQQHLLPERIHTSRYTPPHTSKPPNCVYNSGVYDVLRVGAFAVVCLLLAAVLALASTLAHVVLLYPKPGCVNRQQSYRDNLIVLSVCRSNRQPNRRVQHRWSRDWVRRLRGCGRGRGSCGA